MNAIDPLLQPVHGRVDAEGRLVHAEPRLHDLNDRAGGAIGESVAVPQIATLVRLAQRLGILISRSVLVADAHEDLEVWVRAQPVDGSVLLTLSGWHPRAPWQIPPSADREADFVRLAADWHWETDAALRLTGLPAEAGARFGFDAGALLGHPLTRLFSLSEDERGGLAMLPALAEHRSFDGQRAVLRDSGRAVRLAAVARLDGHGRFAGFSGGTVMEETEAAASAAPDPGALVPRLDRALRAPLSRIIAYADSISAQAEGPIRRDYADYASDIAGAGRHLMGLIGDLVDLQTIEQPGFAVTAEPIDLADVARRAAGLLNVRAAERQVRIDRPDAEESLPATGEFRRALQILVNLIGNAVRYSPEGGMVWIRTEREGDGAAVIVADQGKGIAREDQARIFAKFGRVDPGEPGGSGLGLYIARTLARAMGGDIVVDSAPGQGARFVFTLPFRSKA